MLIDTFANRLKKALEYNQMKPIELARKTKINKSLISSYLSGVCKAKQDKLDIIAETLGVNEAWLMGYDVDMNRSFTNDKKEKNYTDFNDNDDVKLLVNTYNSLTTSDKEFMLNMIIERKKQIEKESEKK